jgi:hypothetical protein
VTFLYSKATGNGAAERDDPTEIKEIEEKRSPFWRTIRSVPRKDVRMLAPALARDSPCFEWHPARHSRFEQGRVMGMLTRMAQVSARMFSGGRTASDADGLDAFPAEGSLPREQPRPAAPVARSRVSWQRSVQGVLVLATATLAGVGLYSSRPATAASTGVLRVETDPKHAMVQIDGHAEGLAPLTRTLSAGSHHISVTEGLRARAIDIDVLAGVTTVHHVELGKEAPVVEAPPPAATGALEIVTTPAHAAITIDGVGRGFSPVTVAALSVGSHEVVVSTGDATYRRTVQVQPGATASLVVGNTPASTFGWLSARTPVPLQILEQGAVVGTTESDRIMLPVGDHQFEFVNASLGFRSTRRVSIASNRVTALSVDLPQVPVSVNAVPWAEVWIDGTRVGETPIGNLSQSIGTHEILFRNPQFGERRRTIVVTASAPARVSIDMRQQ